MRYLAYCLSVILGSQALLAQDSSSVMLVEPQFSQESRAAFRSMAEFFDLYMPDSGMGPFYSELAEKGLRLNGFLVAIGAERYVLTLAEPIRPAISVRLTWTLRDGTVVSVEDARPVYFDTLASVVFIQVQAPNLPAPFLLSDALPPDGSDVWSPGYQDLLGVSKLETLRGVVSNNRLNLPVEEGERQTTYIQHTIVGSAIGNGSPLFVGTPGRLSSLVGMNVDFSKERADATFAIPGVTLLGALNRCQSYLQTGGSDDQLQEKVDSFVRFLNAPTWKAESFRFLPPDRWTAQGWEVLRDILSTSPRAVVQEWLRRVARRPTDVLRQALSWRFYQESRKSLPFVVSDPATADGETTSVSLRKADLTTDLQWQLRAGEWYLSAIPQLKPPGAIATPEAAPFISWAGDFPNGGLGYEAGVGLPPAAQRNKSTHLTTSFHMTFPTGLRTNMFHVIFSVTGSRFGINPGTHLHRKATGQLFDPFIKPGEIPWVLDQIHIGVGPRLTLPFRVVGRYLGVFAGFSGTLNFWSVQALVQNGFVIGNLDAAWPLLSVGFFPEVGLETEIFRRHIMGIRGFKVFNYPIGGRFATLEEQSLSFTLFYRFAFF